jgi:hypothetical protein
MVAKGVLQDLGRHAQEPGAFPDRHAALHEPGRGSVTQGVWRDLFVKRVRHGRRIDCGLRVISLNVTILGLQDAALQIGEVALRLAVWLQFRRR